MYGTLSVDIPYPIPNIYLYKEIMSFAFGIYFGFCWCVTHTQPNVIIYITYSLLVNLPAYLCCNKCIIFTFTYTKFGAYAHKFSIPINFELLTSRYVCASRRAAACLPYRTFAYVRLMFILKYHIYIHTRRI